MTHKNTLRFLSIAVLALLLAPPVAAESSPEATRWLEKLMSIYERGPFRVDYSASIDMSAIGQPISGTLKGNITQKDRAHSRTEMEMDLAGIPGMSTGPMTMKMLSIADGTTIWTEMENPALGGRQVTKLAMADLEKVSQSMGAMSPAAMDPVAQLEALTTTMDFVVLEENKDEITLRGTITDETRAKVGMLASPGLNELGIEAFLFVLDKRTGFSKKVRADGDTPFMTMSFGDIEFLDEASLPAGLFEYTPAEGLPVMDLGAMMAGQSATH